MSQENHSFEILTIPCLSDNYAYILHGPDGTSLVDAPDSAPIAAALDAKGWKLDSILITHHHSDHVDGVADLRQRYGCAVIGPEAESSKLPPLDIALSEGHHSGLPGLPEIQVVPVPGHTLGHIAYYVSQAQAVFTGDSLMALGCGRLFEGTPAMMWASLQRLMALPAETMVYSGHEYTTGNAKFALTIEPDNADLKTRFETIQAMRQDDEPTAQVPLSLELATNPFLRAGQPSLKAAIGMQDASDVDVFAEIRQRKDRF